MSTTDPKDTFIPEDEMTAEQQQEIAAAEDFVLGFTDDDYADPDKVDELKKHQEKLKTTIHQKRHYREKAKKVVTPAPATPPEKKPENTAAPAAAADDTKAEKIEFRQDHPELSKDLVNDIFDHAKVKGITPYQALELPLIKQMIKSKQTKEDVEDASVPPARKSGSGIEKKDWSTASQEEIVAQRNKILGPGN